MVMQTTSGVERFWTRTIREWHLIFREGGDYFGPGIFLLPTPDPGFLFLAWYGPVFFSARIMRIETKQKRLII